MDPKFDELKSRLHEITDLRLASAVLNWDQETMMPEGGVRARANQISTLRRLAHQKFTSEEMGALLEDLKPAAAQMPYDSFEASLVRVTWDDFEKSVRVPAELVAEMSRAASEGQQIWQNARAQHNPVPHAARAGRRMPAAQGNFEMFRPALEKLLALTIRYAECFAPYESVYDPLLDRAEPGLKTSQLRPIFARMTEEIVPLVKAITNKGSVIDDSVLYQEYPEDKQWQFGLEVAKAFGYDLHRGRQDRSAHPFTTGFSINDVRITTRLDPRFFSMALFGTMHETGHALYMQGHDQSLERTPLASGASSGLHESQSRMWENLVGRSREFWQCWFPRLREHFPNQLAHSAVEKFYRAINKVEPSLIRVEADEVTYNLHIMLRFELEVELLEGRLDVKHLPAAWNAKMHEYLGVTPPDDAAGVLQDIHWSGGGFGGFPSYTLGNIYGPHLFERALHDMPDLRQQFALGEYLNLLTWYREHLHKWGRMLKPTELIQRITGQPLSVEPWIRYIKGKFGEIYEV